jgi:hypothetical protein
MCNFYVYFLRRPDQEDKFEPGRGCPFYVGKGSNGRIGDHRKQANKSFHKSGRKLHKISIIHKLWRQGLDFEEDIILNNLTDRESFEYEKEAIVAYGRLDLATGCLTNLSDGGEGPSNPSIETRQKISRSRKGKCLGENNGFYGRKHSEESLQKMRESHTVVNQRWSK